MHIHYLMFLVEHAAKKVEEEEVGVSALALGSSISKQAAQHDYLLGAGFLCRIHKVLGALFAHKSPMIRCCADRHELDRAAILCELCNHRDHG